MRTRSSPQDLEAAAAAAVRKAISALGIEVGPTSDPGRSDVVVRSPDGTVQTIEVRAAAVPTTDWLAKVDETGQRDLIVVADQIPSGLRDALNERGIAWLDRRGHLRLIGGGFFIDADVPPDEREPSTTTTRHAITGRSGLAAATALLMHPGDPTAVGEVARRSGMNASSISRAMAVLAEAQLAERLSRGRYRPLAPELFWALADVWPQTSVAVRLQLADLSDPRLQADPDDLGAQGWAIGGERGAVGWGAPLILTSDYPTLIYVPDQESIRRASALAGGTGEDANTRRATTELAVDPVGLLTRERFRAEAGPPLAHPVACALALAATSRGRESLGQWDPPTGFLRVW